MADPQNVPAPLGIEVRRDVLIPVSGGAELAATLYLPGASASVPALLVYLPYLKDGWAGITYDHAHRFFAARGYACLLVDFRGTGGSSGATRRAFHPDEAADAAEVIGWAARQEWCDGSVGMWGGSYTAFMSMRTAALQPPALKAIAPIVGHLDPYDDFVYPGGSPSLLGALGCWGASTFGSHLLPPLRQDPEGHWFHLWQERLASYEPYLVGLFEHPERDEFWTSRAVDGSVITTPSFCIAGWQDLFCDGQIRAYEAMTGPKKLWVGPWLHVLPHVSPTEPVDCLEQLARWWDYWLRGVDNGIMDEPPVTVYVQGEETWRHEQEWPPGGAKRRSLFLSRAGELLDEPPADSVEHAYVVDPTVGMTAGLLGSPTATVGRPLEQAADEARSLVFTGPALEEAVLIAGAPEVRLAVAGEVDEANLVVKLSCVAPDGGSMLITRGSVRLTSAGDVLLRLWPTCYQVPAGHRLRLAIAGADFPNLWPTATNPTLRVASGGTNASAISVPVASGRGVDGRMVEPPSPLTDPPLLLDESPTWWVHTDHVTDTVTAAMGGHLLALLPERNGRFTNDIEVRATVRADHPEAARVQGESRIEVSLPGGSTVIVDASIWVTAAGLSLHGRVTLDGHLFFERTWTR